MNKNFIIFAKWIIRDPRRTKIGYTISKLFSFLHYLSIDVFVPIVNSSL